MGGIQGIGGVPEPRPERPSNTSSRDRNDSVPASSTSGGSAQDGVVISSEAQAAAAIARTIQAAQTQPDIRADRVAEARAAIERGDYRQRDVVETVADWVSQYL